MHPGLLTPPPARAAAAAAAAGPALLLPGVTLAAVTSVALTQTVQAMERSLAQARFGAALLLTDCPPSTRLSDLIAWRQIARIDTHAAYSRFMLHELRRHVATSHVLCVQWDGYVLDARGWDRRFLDYDYIGAPWPHFTDSHTVGNGGFSLRSRRLLDACHALDICEAPEDVAICRTHRVELERRFNIRFAPERLARRFAFERHPAEGGEFGFHGVLNLVMMVEPRCAEQIVADLDATMLSRREHRELLGLAIRRGRFRLARILLERMRRRAGRR